MHPPLTTIVHQTASNEQTRRNQQSLRGTCSINSIALANALTDHGYTTHIVYGYLNTTTTHTPTTLPDAHRHAIAHVWVETPTHHLELTPATTTTHPDEPLITRHTPDSYTTLERHPHTHTQPRPRLIDNYHATKPD